MDEKARHAYGAHFTSPSRHSEGRRAHHRPPWRERIEAARTLRRASRRARTPLRRFRVLDPACGSGNFLYVAYRELKRLERDASCAAHARRRPRPDPATRAVERTPSSPPPVLRPRHPPLRRRAGQGHPHARQGAGDHERPSGDDPEGSRPLRREKPLPLDNLDANILCADALFTDWPAADAIIGNPPYLGSRYMPQGAGLPAYARPSRRALPGRAPDGRLLRLLVPPRPRPTRSRRARRTRRHQHHPPELDPRGRPRPRREERRRHHRSRLLAGMVRRRRGARLDRQLGEGRRARQEAPLVAGGRPARQPV